MVIAFQNFRDEEYLVPKSILEQANIRVDTISTQLGVARGKLGHFCGVDLTLDDLQVKDYSAIVFVGGPGVPSIRSHPKSVEHAVTFFQQRKLVGAICWAPTILAKAGILSGKRATCWVGFDEEYRMTTDKVLASHGAIFVNQPVVQDGNIITANGPSAAREFGNMLVDFINANMHQTK